MELGDEYVHTNYGFVQDYIEKFQLMWENNLLCDITFRAGNVSISAHRLILAAGIPYFKEAFTIREGNPSDEISVAGIDPQALKPLIDYAYKGKITITTQNVVSLFSASAFFKVVGIQQACCEFLSKRLRIENVFTVWQLAEQFLCSKLLEQCDSFLRKNFVEYSKTEDFLKMPFDNLKKLIESDDLRVESEEDVFEAVMRWIKVPGSERQLMLPELLKGVRMTFLNFNYLFESVTNEEMIHRSVSCQELLDEVKFYHLLPERRHLFSSFNTRVRNYVKKLYAVCFSESTGCTIQFYDFKSEKWSVFAKNRTYDCFIDMVVSDERIYFFGGRTFGSFDLRRKQWSTQETLHEQFCGAGVALHSNKIYIFGNSSRHLSRRVCCFDIYQNRWLQEGYMLEHRTRPGVVPVGDDIYVLGGYPDGMRWNAGVHYSVERYNPDARESHALAPMLTGRYWFGVGTLKGKIYVCGGCNANRTCFYSAEVFNPSTNEWHFVSPMNSARQSVSLVSYNDKLYAIGGRTSVGATRDVEIYDPETDAWSFANPVNIDDDEPTTSAGNVGSPEHSSAAVNAVFVKAQTSQ